MILQTRPEHVDTIIARTNAEHPYETVHVVVAEALAMDPTDEQWVLDQTLPGES